MFDFQSDILDAAPREVPVALRGNTVTKRCFDVAVALVLLVPLAVLAVGLFLLNPFANAGSLLFYQKRMGQQCRPFTAYKFRTMRAAVSVDRGAFDALEHDRVTPLGAFLRKTRIDELPQIINVLRGEMSLIGPRPDCYDHARVYLREIPGYASRHAALPGISGLAQTQVGYVDGYEGVIEKVAADHYYLKHASFRLDMWIAWRTICVVLGRQGS